MALAFLAGQVLFGASQLFAQARSSSPQDLLRAQTKEHDDQVQQQRERESQNFRMSLVGQLRPIGPRPSFPSHFDFLGMTLSRERAFKLHSLAGDKVAQIVDHAALESDLARKDKSASAFNQIRPAELPNGMSEDRRSAADRLLAKGSVYMSKGDFNQAVQFYKEAMPILRSVDDKKGEAELFITFGWAYQAMGETPTAIGCYQAALTLFAENNDKDGEVRARLAAASIFAAIGESRKAEGNYDLALAKVSKDQRAIVLVSLADLLQSIDRPREALKRYEEAASEESFKNWLLEASIDAGRGRCWMLLRSYESSQSAFKKALVEAKKTRNRAAEAGIIAEIGELNYWMAMESASGQDWTSHLSKALNRFYEAQVVMRDVGDRQGEIGVLSYMGLVYDAQGKKDKALSYYLEALKMVDQLQTTARLEEFRINLADQSVSVYQRAVQLEIDLHDTEEAFDLSERARARSFLDQLGDRRMGRNNGLPTEFQDREDILRQKNVALEAQIEEELAKPGPDISPERVRALQLELSVVRQEYEGMVNRLQRSDPQSASLLSVSPLTLRAVQEQLPSDLTVVSYFTTGDESLAFVITKDRAFLKELPVTEAKLSEEVLDFLDFAGPDDGLPTLASLYFELIAPIKSELKTSKLVVVPYGALHDLSFAALTDGTHYLGDDYVLSYLPSVSVLPYLHARIKPASGQTLVLANDEEKGLPYMGQANAEADGVASIMGTRPVLGNAATISALRKSAGDFDIVHLIAHVELDQRSFRFSRILLGRGQGEDGALRFDDVLGLDLKKTNLVVLSGCQSQMGKRSRGDDMLGLSRAFMYAGAPSVMASLWSVDDEATRQLMVAFYTHLKTGMSKAEALRSAQADVRQKYPNPFYWAGFTLMGDPSPSYSITPN
jgi:tetratricopeptide (TPR) repeat protein